MRPAGFGGGEASRIKESGPIPKQKRRRNAGKKRGGEAIYRVLKFLKPVVGTCNGSLVGGAVEYRQRGEHRGNVIGRSFSHFILAVWDECGEEGKGK